MPAPSRTLDPHAAADHRSRLYRLAWSLLDDDRDAAGAGDPEVAALAGEVYAEIGRLPAPLRDVVAAVDVAGLTYIEAAETLRIPTGPS